MWFSSYFVHFSVNNFSTGHQTIVTEKSTQLCTLVLPTGKRRMQARHKNVVKIIAKFIRKEI
jgi:hypothetical protein